MRDLYFIAIIPAWSLARDIDEIRHQLWRRFETQYALNAPPHLTLVPPFDYAHYAELIKKLQSFQYSGDSFSLRCAGFGHFGNRTVFVSLEESTELLAFQSKLQSFCEKQLGLQSSAQGRTYHPHITLANRDLDEKRFPSAWEYVQKHTTNQIFSVSYFYLLRHSGKRWLLDRSIALNS